MIRRLGLVVATGLLLAGCGTVSPQEATKKWTDTTNFPAAFHNLKHDLDRTVLYLGRTSRDTLELRTLCRVLSLDLHKMNDSLPSPDSQGNSLLADGLDTLSQGTALCASATGESAVEQIRAKLRAGFGGVYFGALRIWSVAGLRGQPH